MGSKIVVGTALLVGCLGPLVACGGEGSGDVAPREEVAASAFDAVEVLAEPSLSAPVPAPTGPVLLTIRGAATTNVGGTLQLDRALLDQLGTASLTVEDEQAMGGEHEFTGPLMSDVLALAGAGEAETMVATAVNDYVVEVPVSDATDLPLVLATEVDGAEMSVARYGPLRFVYPDEQLELDPAVYDARWIWQLVELDLE